MAHGKTETLEFRDGQPVIKTVEYWDTPDTYTWTVPDRVTTVEVCMIGGGGSGKDRHPSTTEDVAGGGWAGDITHRTVSVIPGEDVTVVVGWGGSPGGGSGLQSQFHTAYAWGGSAGTLNGGYNGKGDARSTCFGTAYDGKQGSGNTDSRYKGGQAGFSDGTDGVSWDDGASVDTPTMGAGSGSYDSRTTTGAWGGHGYVKITYYRNPYIDGVFFGRYAVKEAIFGSVLNCLYWGDTWLWCRTGQEPPPPPSPTPPSTISDFSASDNKMNEITMTWSNADGYPTPKYDLYSTDSGLIASNVQSGYSLTVTGPHTEVYYVVAINSEGQSTSNQDSGTAIEEGACVPPGHISDFYATPHNGSYVTCSWSYPSGDPRPRYDLYIEGAGKVRDNITSPYKDYRSVATRTYYVIATNDCGVTESNHSTSEPAMDPPGSIEFNTPGNHTWRSPLGYSTISVCAIGGGGGGAVGEDVDAWTTAGGGHAGNTSQTNITVTDDTNYTVTIGSGGAGKTSNVPEHGNSGSATKIVNTWSGGSGGDFNTYDGDGGSRSTCMGSYRDGYRNVSAGNTRCAGGQAGFGNGGSGATPSAAAGSGIRGAGGGGTVENQTSRPSGNGGSGVAKLTWGSYIGKTTLVELLDEQGLAVNKVLLNEPYTKWRNRANHVLALWKIQGYSINNYANASSIIEYASAIDNIIATKSIEEITNTINKG